jgi:hypothetical protein
MNAMRQLNSGNGDARIVERLEAGHGSTEARQRIQESLTSHRS